jgi:hypothetical protein
MDASMEAENIEERIICKERELREMQCMRSAQMEQVDRTMHLRALQMMHVAARTVTDDTGAG